MKPNEDSDFKMSRDDIKSAYYNPPWLSSNPKRDTSETSREDIETHIMFGSNQSETRTSWKFTKA